MSHVDQAPVTGQATDPSDDEDTDIRGPLFPQGQRFALASDGAVLIELTTHLIPHIQGRDVLQFVALTEAERSDALESAEHGLSETAARISGQLVKRAKGASS